MTKKASLEGWRALPEGQGLGLHGGYSIIRDLLVVIQLELLFLFRSSEFVSVTIRFRRLRGPKPQQQGKGPRAVEAPGVPFPQGLAPSWRRAMNNSVLQKPQGPEHDHSQKQVYLETSTLESSQNLRRASRSLKELVYQIAVP